jgi:hypothetical protein
MEAIGSSGRHAAAHEAAPPLPAEDDLYVPWAGAAEVAGDLAAHRLPLASAALDTALDSHRNPRALDWCQSTALQQGHVLLLYKSCRNGLKWCGQGKLSTTDDLAFGLFFGLALIIRVAQDVQTCITDLGRPHRSWVFSAFCDKVSTWVAQWPADMLPPLQPIVRRVFKWVTRGSVGEHHSAWPAPAWATSFTLPAVMGTTFVFAEPSSNDIAALGRCLTLGATRADVIARAHLVLDGATAWDRNLSKALAALVT